MIMNRLQFHVRTGKGIKGKIFVPRTSSNFNYNHHINVLQVAGKLKHNERTLTDWIHSFCGIFPAGHTDSPNLRVKAHSMKSESGCVLCKSSQIVFLVGGSS